MSGAATGHPGTPERVIAMKLSAERRTVPGTAARTPGGSPAEPPDCPCGNPRSSCSSAWLSDTARSLPGCDASRLGRSPHAPTLPPDRTRTRRQSSPSPAIRTEYLLNVQYTETDCQANNLNTTLKQPGQRLRPRSNMLRRDARPVECSAEFAADWHGSWLPDQSLQASLRAGYCTHGSEHPLSRLFLLARPNFGSKGLG